MLRAKVDQIYKDKPIDISNKRVFASIIDWVLSGVICGIPGVIVFCILTQGTKALTNLYSLKSMGLNKWGFLTILILSILLTFIYYVFIPLRVYPGQTLGKHICHLKIVHLDGKKLSLNDYILREF